MFFYSPLIRNKMYQKMQREKLYNLHKTACFITAGFVFKMDKILSENYSLMKKYFFSDTRWIRFTYFIFVLPDMFIFFCLKTDTRRCSVKSSTIYEEKL